MSNNSHPPRILVVDDELLIRWALREALEAKGFTVTEATDAASARSALDRADGRPDAVVLDYRLPDSNDLGLLATMCRLSPPMPVVMMTAHGTDEMVKQALELGAYTVASKPFEVQHIVDLVTAAVAAR